MEFWRQMYFGMNGVQFWRPMSARSTQETFLFWNTGHVLMGRQNHVNKSGTHSSPGSTPIPEFERLKQYPDGWMDCDGLSLEREDI